jgi:hypothetical protein
MPASSNVWEVYQCPVTGLHFDPFRVLATLHRNAEGKLNDLVKASDRDPDAALKLALAGRVAFGVPNLVGTTGQGYPDAVVLAMIEKFAEYARGKGSGAGNWRTWSQPRVPPASSAPTTTSPSGSTSVASMSAGPAPCPRR